MTNQNLKITWKSETRKIDELKPFEGNPRKADEKETADLDRSLDKFSLADPLVINTDGEVIGGNFRMSRLKEKGIKIVDVRVPSRRLTRPEAEELNLRLNKNTGSWDFGVLANFSEDMLMEVGFESEELDKIFQLDAGEDDFDVEEELQKPAKTKLGELYQLGEHRLLCGDSTKKEDVERLMGGEEADMVFTDPPYNMNYKSQKKGGIMNDSMSEENFVQFSMDFISRMKESIKTGGVFYICTGYNSLVPFMYSLKAHGIELQDTIIWVKNTLGMGMNDYRHKHETIIKAKKGKKKGLPIMYGWNGGKHYFMETHSEADVWEIKRRASNTMCHPTQKPIELIGRAIRNSSKREEIVLDLFGGSGSTLISAEKEGRKCFINELDPKYADVILNRFEKLTGIKPEKIGEANL